MANEFTEEGQPNVEEYMQSMDFENKNLRNENLKLSSSLSAQNFNEQDEQNLIHYQLETDKFLERIEHFLKGDQIKFGDGGVYYTDPTKKILAILKQDKKTKIKYFIQEIKENKKGTEVLKEVLIKIINKDNEDIEIGLPDSKSILGKLKKEDLENFGYKYIEIVDEEKKPFNEYGVAELMRIVSMYVTKETFLSFYSDERINEILGDLGDAINNFLYCNYEKMGMDTKFKESKYTIICLNLLHAIESCYRRAIEGLEQENLRTRAIVTQNQGGGNFGNNQRNAPMKKKWNPLKPSTW